MAEVRSPIRQPADGVGSRKSEVKPPVACHLYICHAGLAGLASLASHALSLSPLPPFTPSFFFTCRLSPVACRLFFNYLIIMLKPICKLVCLFFITANCYSQVNESFPYIDKDDLPDARFQPARTFTGTSLFGYIDGGAELYLEYGFSSAWVSEIGFMGGKYKTEIYRMTGPEEAFGIFSVSKYKCRSMPPISPYTCQTRYQLQICAGPYYISIINGSGSKTDSIASLRIGEAIVNRIKEPSADFSSYLPRISNEEIRSSAILAKGKLGIMNGAPDWEDYFKDCTGFCVVILPGKDNSVLSVRFNSNEDLEKFVSLHKWDPRKISIEKNKFSTGEIVSKLSDNHLLIEIPK
jgi:hypothetical protein